MSNKITITGTLSEIKAIVNGDTSSSPINVDELKTALHSYIDKALSDNDTALLAKVNLLISKAVAQFITASKLTTTIKPYVKITTLLSMLNDYVKKSGLTNYMTKAQIKAYFNSNSFKNSIISMIEHNRPYVMSQRNSGTVGAYITQINQDLETHGLTPYLIVKENSRIKIRPLTMYDPSTNTTWFLDYKGENLDNFHEGAAHSEVLDGITLSPNVVLMC